VVENSKIPRVTFSMVFDYDPVYEGHLSRTDEYYRTNAPETATETRTKEMIDDEIDFIGASMNAPVQRAFLHQGFRGILLKLPELIADVLINARFEQEHFDRIMTQNRSNLSMSKK
jgi:zinc protease